MKNLNSMVYTRFINTKKERLCKNGIHTIHKDTLSAMYDDKASTKD